jgi:hypothetical protein
MARNLQFSGEMQWPLEDGKQASKLDLLETLTYGQAYHAEKLYAAPVTDEALPLPFASAKFILMQAKTADVDVKLNGNANAISLKADAGFFAYWNEDGGVTALSVTTAVAPATLVVFAFA